MEECVEAAIRRLEEYTNKSQEINYSRQLQQQQK